jgi:hypothetical protein
VARPRSSAEAACAAVGILLAAASASCGHAEQATVGATAASRDAAAPEAPAHQRTAPAAGAAADHAAALPSPAARVVSRPGHTSRYAFVDRPVRVRVTPRRTARSLGRLTTRTPDHTDELVLVLRTTTAADGSRWLQVRTPLKPAGTTGWVPRAALSRLGAVDTWLVVDRRRLTARLVRNGRVVFRAPVAIGKASTPTPPGRFYVRDRLLGLPAGGIYGPIAFGTSASSDTVTDWPGGSIVGIHGTDEPQRIPGRVSHGCIRLRNAAIRRLSGLMPVGTPVTIR